MGGDRRPVIAVDGVGRLCVWAGEQAEKGFRAAPREEAEGCAAAQGTLVVASSEDHSSGPTLTAWEGLAKSLERAYNGINPAVATDANRTASGVRGPA